jgi:hypothetical protein
MPKVTQIVVTMQKKAGVNITALSAPEIRGRGKVRLVVDNLGKAKDVLKVAKVRFSEEEVFAITLDNRPGMLGEVAEKLSRAKINIKYAYATTSDESVRAKVILAVTNVAKGLMELGGLAM